MAKHSKVKNTGILFELLVRQITTDTLNGVEKSPAIAIIKEYFGKRTTLKTELHLYQTLLKEKHNTEYRAEKLVDLVIRERAKLSATNSREIRRQNMDYSRKSIKRIEHTHIYI